MPNGGLAVSVAVHADALERSPPFSIARAEPLQATAIAASRVGEAGAGPGIAQASAAASLAIVAVVRPLVAVGTTARP